MVISTKTVKEQPPKVDITELYVKFSMNYKNVFMVQLQNEVFIYRALRRSEFYEIMNGSRFNDVDKEEFVCQECLLYPDPEIYDWDNCAAGIPTTLSKEILKNSYLDENSLQDRMFLRDIYRTQMNDLDNQITCVISEAFPYLTLEEIENFDVDTATKYLTRAEWKLQNLHGIKFEDPEFEQPPIAPKKDFLLREKNPLRTPGSQLPPEPESSVNIEEPEEVIEQPKQKTLRGGDKSNKLTPEKMKEREKFLAKFPEFANDDVLNQGIKGLEQPSVDTRPPALRVGF